MKNIKNIKNINKSVGMLLVLAIMLSMLAACAEKSGAATQVAERVAPIPIEEFVEIAEVAAVATTEETIEEPIETPSQGLSVILDEETNIYRFAYKKSALNMSREKFEEYELTNNHIRKFFDEMEKVYVLFADFFLVHDLPDIFTYNSITEEYRESIVEKANAFARVSENATYYIEGLLEGYLQNIDIGFPGIVAHEVGHLFTAVCIWNEKNNEYIYRNGIKYVWDFEVFATIAMEYLASLPDFNVIDVFGNSFSVVESIKRGIGTDGFEEWFKTYQGFIYFKVLTMVEKYGYGTLHEVLAEMVNVNKTNPIRIKPSGNFDLFFDVYTEKTGKNLKEEYFTPEELSEIYKNIN